ncbi:MAG: hypothetical protein JWO94_2717, partial [Verrucomicrobiaceae bacterium]|nr:hypothetical protein [Verrucomicrobiaceae bacterium]
LPVKTPFFDRPIVWRFMQLVASIGFLGLGVYGVRSTQQQADALGVHVPNDWYWLPVIPTVLIAISAFLLPARFLYPSRNSVQVILCFIVSLVGGTGILLYIIYDVERISEHRVPAQHANPRDMHPLHPLETR